MPAGGQAPGDVEELVLGRVVDEALEEIEADAPDAAVMQRREIGVRNGGIDDGDAARLPFGPGDGVEGCGIVGAVAARLDDDVASEAEMIAQREEHVRPGIFGQIFGLGREGEVRHRPEDMAMGVDRTGRRRVERLGRMAVPGSDASHIRKLRSPCAYRGAHF